MWGQTYYVYTTGTNAQGIDVNHKQSWTIHVSSGTQIIGGGRFDMKRGSTADNLTLTLHSGISPSTSVLAQVVVPASSISPSGGFNDTLNLLHFSVAQSLAAGDYLMVLSSTAATTNGYTIKGVSGAVSLDGTPGTAAPLSSTATAASSPQSLSVSKTATASVAAGGTITYGINLGNSGGTDSTTAATVADQLPAGVTATAATPGAGVTSVNCTNLNSTAALLTCTVTLSAALPAVSADGTAAFTITATAPGSGGTVTNFASVDASGGASPPTPAVSCTTANCASASTSVVGTQSTLTAVATPASIAYNATSALSSTGGSGTGAVTYSVVTGGSNCSITGTTLTGNGIGTCTVTATKAADTNYTSATSAAITITVGQATQSTLTASATPASIAYNATSALSSTGGSGTGAVTYSVVTGTANCSITRNSLTSIGTGPCAVIATKAADTNYAAETSAAITITITPTSQSTLTLSTSNATIVKGTSATLSATGGSGTGAITFQVATGAANCSITGATLTALAPGNCTITATKAADANFNFVISMPIAVTTIAPALQLSLPSLSINLTVGNVAIPARIVQVTATGPVTNISIFVSNGNWLTTGLTSTSVAPGSAAILALQVLQTGLTAGIYNSNVTISAPGVASVTLPVTLTVANFTVAQDTSTPNPNRPPTAAADLQAGQQKFYETRLNGQTLSSYNSETFVLQSNSPTSTPQYQVEVTPATATYLIVELISGNPPRLKITAQTSQLPPGSYNAQVTINQVTTGSTTAGLTKTSARALSAGVEAPLAASSPPLVLDISTVISIQATAPSPSATVTPASITVSSNDDGTVLLAPLAVSSPTPQTFTVTLANPGTWLTATPVSATTPATIALSTLGGLVDGSYFNSVVISFPASGQTISVPVTAHVRRANYRLSSSQGLLNLTATTGNIGQSVYTIIKSSDVGGVPFRLKTTPPWLRLTPSSGDTPALVSVTPDATKLSAGTYTGQIVVITDVPPLSLFIQATLTVLECTVVFGADKITIPENVFSASVILGSPANCPWTLSSDSSWMLVTTPTGTGTSRVSFDLSPNLSGSPRTATLSSGSAKLLITEPPTRPAIGTTNSAGTSIPATVHGATMVAGPVAPGQIVSIFGTAFGPYQSVSYQLTADSSGVTSTLADVQVFFDKVPAPMLMASFGQVNVIAPWALDGQKTTNLQVVRNGIASAVAKVQVVPTNPGLFTVGQNGMGQAAVLNQDWTLNNIASPAHPGDILQIFATGGGMLTFPAFDGQFATPPFSSLLTPIRVTIAGKDADIVYAGAAPTQVNGMVQINARIPAATQPGDSVPITITAGNATSPATATVVIR